MAIAEQDYIGDGSTKVFPFTFPYLEPEHVLASVDGDLRSITLATDTTPDED